MSLHTLFNRVVALQWPASEAGDETRDRHGVLVDDPTPGSTVARVRARRDQVAQGEDVAGRDQQSATFLYLLALRDEDGVEFTLAPSGRGWIVDADVRLEVVGPPELVHRRRRPHHWELRAVERRG